MQANFNTLAAGSTFVVPADADDVIYTLHADGTVSSEGMIDMTADEAKEAFDGVELRVTSVA